VEHQGRKNVLITKTFTISEMQKYLMMRAVLS